MDKAPPTQTTDTSSNKISADSNYGSLITESSSSCLSLLSESDLLDEPSTSGCSSEMASVTQSREKKRQKVKEFLRELKSMVPNQFSGSKLGTLSTLDYVVSSMRKITEEQKQEKSSVFKAPSSEPVALPSLHCPDSVDFRNVNDGIVLNAQSEYYHDCNGLGMDIVGPEITGEVNSGLERSPTSWVQIGGGTEGVVMALTLRETSDLSVAVSSKSHVVLHTSTAFMDLLGYPQVWWKGRLLKDFVHKKDVMTVNSYINSETSENDALTTDARCPSKKNETSKQPLKQFFYARIRRFRSLSSGFSLSSSGSYVFFKVMVTCKSPENASELATEEQKTSKRFLMLYFAPMTSPYKDGQLPPEAEQRTFSLRHSLFCTYTYTHANTVALLGFLPQDIVGTSIFDYYHPDDLPQLLDIYKKAMHSMGQPFKSGLLRIRTRNGTYVKVTTEWSSFMNPWDHKLEFIIAQHTIVKPPENPNVFEDGPDDRKTADSKTMEASWKLVEKIKDLLQKPMTLDTGPQTPSDSGCAASCSPQLPGGSTPTRDGEKNKEKIKNEGSQGTPSPSDISSSLIDEKSISSLYNQVNYSLNIKKFLLSHPKAFPVSDEDSSTDLVQKDDSEEDMNEEEEMQVEIPVVRPPSCGSSTQVHVSEQGFHEEVPSPPSFGGEDPSLTRETIDNQLVLTEDSLRKHTKAQELLYLQEASKEQPHLFHMKSRRPLGQRSRQKRSRPSGLEETTDVFKFARTSKGQRGNGTSGSPGLFMSNFPMTAVDIKPTASQPTNTGMTTSAPNMVSVVPGTFQPGMGVMPQLTVLPIDPTASMHLQPYLPTPGSNMQWPYYPQSGYSLLPQVMAGFYQPMLQPVPLTTAAPAPSFSGPPPHKEQSSFSCPGKQQQKPQRQKGMHPRVTGERSCHKCRAVHRHSHSGIIRGQPYGPQGLKVEERLKNGTDSDNHLSSADDTTSSIQYLLDAVSANNSSPNEEMEEKLRQKLQPSKGTKLPRQRSALPPWLQTLNWTPEVRLMYKLPMLKVKNVLKKDREALKKMTQSECIKIHLETLLEEVDSPDYLPALDEEADYIFYPEVRRGDVDVVHTASEGEGEKTPTVVFDLDTNEDAGKSQHNNNATSHKNVDENRDEDSSPASGGEEISPSMEVVITEDPSEPLLDETAGESLNMSESLEKVHSPASEGSNSSGKKGIVEGSAASPTMCTLGVGSAKSAVAAMERKDASSDDGRSDVGSDKGSENSSNNSRQKNEDAQSSSSKVSSSLTPSEERSTEDAGSSMKESDMSTPKDSCTSSNDKMSTDSGAESSSTIKPDILEKLFVPLKVNMCHGGSLVQSNKVLTLPFWQLEACMSDHVTLQYNLPPLDLDTILANDRRRLSDMRQPYSVSCQLLELLHEIEGQSQRGDGGLKVPISTHEVSAGQLEVPKDGSAIKSANLMQPPSHKKSDSALNTHQKIQSISASSKDSCKSFHKGLPKPDADFVGKQLLDKLQSITSGQHSDDWPADVIMNKVFLPADLVSNQTSSETTDRTHEAEILDSVD